MKVYYQDRDALVQIEEPYKSALAIMMDLYIEGPEGMPKLEHNKFLEYMAINCVRQVCENIKRNPTIYVTTICGSRDRMFQPGKPRQNAFKEGYRVGHAYEAATIIGAVYFVMAVERVLSESELEKIEKIATWVDGTAPYFNVFKKAVEEHPGAYSILNIRDQKGKEDMADGHKRPAKAIVLASKRGSDFVRTVLAMHLSGYFVHEDGSDVSATEVGTMLTRVFGRKTEWKSLLQKAFECDNPLKTFDELRDMAHKYWSERLGITDKKGT